jgi:hypothetical protein
MCERRDWRLENPSEHLEKWSVLAWLCMEDRVGQRLVEKRGRFESSRVATRLLKVSPFEMAGKRIGTSFA